LAAKKTSCPVCLHVESGLVSAWLGRGLTPRAVSRRINLTRVLGPGVGETRPVR